ncbi:Major facilitator transporter [Pseudomonas coronafaciens pv. porri]|nr:Major facilitator transporter [Pseudomonas coronafaciens pv. porri]RMU85211.1 Major facilitator transporter [Pseudomonas coronafaciens pv. porri]RMW04056.1 Major facilitator transporter [Pseudomonas coronafaciens pv. porri]RMW07141.1 Major facilitator transporter [Pseudomonas coronafaciens pv. porri]
MQNSAPIMDEKTLRWMPWVIAIAFFMQSLDGTILNTALPSMARSLAEDPLRMQSVVIAYMLTIALLIPASGWIADRFGIKRIFFSAILLFSFGSLLCALSWSLDVLVAARVIQGLGGALMVPIGRLIVLRAYPRSELVRILGFITVPGLLGPLLGPTLGGWMVEYLSWHWIFLINIPVGLLGCYAVKHFIPDLAGGGRTHFDGIGFILFGAAMVLITIALEGLGELHLPHMRVVLLLFAGMGCLAAYWLRAGHIESPLFAPSLFRTRTFAVGIMGNLFARLGSGALPFLVPLLLQVALGYSPSQAGMSMLPLAAAGMFAKTVARWLIEHLGYRHITYRQYAAAGNPAGQPRAGGHGDPLLGAADTTGAARRGEFVAVHGDEYCDADRPRRRQRRERQQPAFSGRAAVAEPWSCQRCSIAGRFQ